MVPHRCFHAIGVLAGLAVLISTPACSEMLGFDDVAFSPALPGVQDASATDGSAHDTGTADHEAGAVDGTPPEPDAFSLTDCQRARRLSGDTATHCMNCRGQTATAPDRHERQARASRPRLYLS